MSNLFSSPEFNIEAITGGATVWSGEWLAKLLNPFISNSFNGVGDSGRWSGLGIRKSLLLSELDSGDNLLSDKTTFSSLLSFSLPLSNNQISSPGIDPLTGQSSDIQALLAAAVDARLPGLTTTLQSKVNDQHITTADDNRSLTPKNLQTDDTAPVLTLALQTDTGRDATDGITQTPILVGTVSDESALVRVTVSGKTSLDITDQVQPDGSFTLDETFLEKLFGSALVDGTYEITVTAEDFLGNAAEPVQVVMTLDRTAAEVVVLSPLVEGSHSAGVHLLGSTSEVGTLSTTLDNGTAVEVDVTNILDQAIQTVPLRDGAHQLTVRFSDVAGNITEQVIDFDVDDGAFVIGATDINGWAATKEDEILLAEGNSFITQAQVPISLGQSEGGRTLRFAVDTAFDATDETTASTDTLAVYLVSNADPTQTLLDNGTAGTPVFSLTGDTADFTPGLVTYDGQFVEIDLTALEAETEGTLVFQLLNQDEDTGSRIHISQLTNTVHPEGTEALRFNQTDTVVTLGGELALENLSVSTAIDPVFSQIRFNPETGEYTAHLQLRNTGDTSISRQAAVVFDSLPDGVSLETVSGTDENGNSYVSFYNAIRPGGLAAGALSDAIEITVSNPEQLQLILTPQLLVGGPNQAPIFGPIDPIEVMPGQRIEIPLNAVDPNGDRVTYSLRTNTELPNGLLDGTGTLSFEPTPSDIGTYSFTVIATDGAETVEQTITLNVVPDPITTTRISGRVLDTNGAPLANLPIELGRLQTVTDSEGYFILTIPDTSFPTDELDIAVPFGDRAFDPFLTGAQVIDLRRTTFDSTTGTDISNPLRHPNLVSAYMNASMVYGNDTRTADALRTLDGTGQLKVSDNDLLPLNNTDFFPDGPLPNSNRSLNDPTTLFATGDVRANENMGLTAMHTVFVREHNRLTTEIQAANPELSGDEIYNRARKQVAAQIQHITYSEYLPLLIGSEALETYTGYDETADPAISHLFSAAAFRMGHTQSFNEFLLVDNNGEALPSVSLRESTFNPEIIHQYGIDAILRGLYAQSAEAIDTKVIDELRNTLFGPPGAGGIDLAAVDIERGRDVGLPDYNQARVDMGLAPVTSFAEITSDTAVQAVLEQLYGTVDDIDVIVGGLAEDHVPGAMVGELFQTVIADQFMRLRDGDRFWYENGQFTQAELDDIRGTTLADLIQRNTDITSLPDYVFSNQGAPAVPGAAGTVASETVTEYGAIDGSGHGQPGQGLPGDLMGVNYTQEYGDGIRSLAGENRPNTREISNALFAQTESIPDAQGGTGFMLAWSQFMGHDLAFSPAGAADTLKFYGTEYESPTGEEFPYVAEKIDLVLGHSLYAGVNNVIERPIYLPALDIFNNEQTKDAEGNITVTNDMLGAEVFVAAGSLSDREGNPFDEQLTISEVPPDLTPAVLPENLSPDLVVTIQPGEMVFETPAQLTLPNRAGWPPGMEMELWSINPTTGEFESVGMGVISDDGNSVETTEGGIRNSSWHFFAPGPLDGLDTDDPRNPDHRCGATEASEQFSSNVNLASGGIIETHDLVSYQSLGSDRGITLTYDSLRADPRPIIHANMEIPFSGRSVLPNNTSEFKLISKLKFTQGNFEYEVPGFEGGKYGLDGGEHFWDVRSFGQDSLSGKPALQADLKDLASGVYEYAFQAGLYAFNEGSFSGSSSTITNSIVHVNGTQGQLGNGWGIAGVKELIENADGSVLIIDGNGSEVVFEHDGVYVAPPGHFSTLHKLEDGTFQQITKEQTVYSFDSNNRLVSIKDRNGNETQHGYNTEGQLTEIIDPVGLTTRFEYVNGRISKIIDPAQRETILSYDVNGNLIRITDPDSSSRQFTYDAKGHMVGETDKRGYREVATYDFAGRAQQAVGKDGSIIKVKPPQVEGLHRPEETSTDPFESPKLPNAPEKQETTYSDGRGQVKTTILDAAGQAISVRDRVGTQYSIQRNDDNLVEEILTGRDKRSTFEYDDRGNLIRLVDELSESGYSASGIFDLGNPGAGEANETIFGNQGYFPTIEPKQVITADLNNDGNLDLVAVNNRQSSDEEPYISTFFGDAQGNFSGSNIVVFNSNLVSLNNAIVDDFDGDGNQDIIVLADGDNYSNAYGIAIAFGNGDGTFTEGPVLEEEGALRGNLQSLQDLDDDGYNDIVYIKNNDLPTILFGNPDRSFEESLTLTTDSYGSVQDSIDLADINGDGALDIVRLARTTYSLAEGSGYSNGVEIFLNQGNRTFSAPVTFNKVDGTGTAYDIHAFEIADLNADGFDDIISIQERDASITTVLGDATASLSQVDEYAIDHQPDQINVADLNSDNQLDIVTVDGSTDTVSVLATTETGFGQPTSYAIGNYVDETYLASAEGSLVLHDINNDGDLDIITANEDSNSISLLLNQRNGAFASQTEYAVGESPRALTLNDLNQDGYADIVVANSEWREGFISVLLNQRNGEFDHTPSIPDLSVTPVQTLPFPTFLADMNGDGVDDIVAKSSGTLFIQLNNGDATFAEPLEIELDDSAQGSVGDFAVGDFNQDDTLDIVVSTRSGNVSNIVPIISNENRELIARTPLVFSGGIVDVGDFNGDGNLDVLSQFQDAEGIESFAIWSGDGTGAFQQEASSIKTTSRYDSLVTNIGDFNNDDLDDIIYLYRSADVFNSDAFITTLLSNGDGTFTSSFTQQLAPGIDGSDILYSADLELADLDRDGVIDLALTYEYEEGSGNGALSHETTRSYLEIFSGVGDGSFVSQQTYEIGRFGRTQYLEVADVNDDEIADILISSPGFEYGVLSVLLGDVTGQFDLQDSRRHQDYAVPRYGDFLAGNLNFDNYLDVMVGNAPVLNQLGAIETDPDSDPIVGDVEVRELVNAKLFTYDDTFSQLTSATDELGNKTVFTIDETNGNTLEMRQVIGEVGGSNDIVTTYTYTSFGLVDLETDDLGRVKDYDYDNFGRLSQITLAQGTEDEAIQEFGYDAAGNLTRFVDENGNVTLYNYDDMNRLVHQTKADPDGAGPEDAPVTTFDYDEAGNLIETTDANNNITSFTYDELNRLTQRTDADEQETDYVYDSAGNVISITNARGEITTYRYDARNRLIEETDADGGTTSYVYDADNNLTAIKDARGTRTTYSYDARNRLITVRDTNGQLTKYDYNAADNLVAVQDRNGHIMQYRYDQLNRLVDIEDALGYSIKTTYDEVGNVASSTDQQGNVTSYGYDNRNRLVQMTDALDGQTRYGYDDASNLISNIDELGRETTYVYDALNRLTQITDPLNHNTNYRYDAFGNLTQVAGELDRVVNYSYDNLNRQTRTTDAYGKTTITAYDEVGNVVSVTNKLGHTTRYDYDGRDWLTRTTDALGHAITYDYDAVGNLTSLTDALGNQTRYEYDELNRQTKTIDALSQVTRTTYDNEGNILSITDATENVTTYTYDQRNLLATETITVDGVDLNRSYDYDAVGNLIERLDRNGRIQTFGYDALNRLDTEQWLDDDDNPIRTITYGYDAVGQLRSLSDPDAVYTYDYDLAGRLIEVDNNNTPGVPRVVFHYGYDAANNLTSVTDRIDGVQAGVESFTYDLLNRMTQVTQSGTGVAEKRVDMAYDAASQMKELNRFSDLAGTQTVAKTIYDYDAAGRLTDLTHQRGPTALADYGFSYDDANRLTQLVTPDGTSDYGYNSRSELISSDHSYQTNETYDYDATGNRTNYVTGDHNRILEDGTYTYEYDNEGNRTRRVEIETGEITNYTWDHRNRLTAVVTTTSDGTVLKEAAYTYDAYDRRIAKVVDADGEGATTSIEEHFVYDGDHIALVFNGDGNQTHRYLHGPQIDQVLAEETADGKTRWALTDHQGSVRDVIDNQGTVLNHITYNSFGQVISETNHDLDFRFGYTGRELDEETSLMYYRARYFDPAVGTFVSEDPLGFDAGDANVYRYVFNSPLNFTDPTGQYIESGWDLLSLGVGLTSLGVNLRGGDWKNAAIDGVGITADLGALLLPVPGGVSAVRNAEKVGKVATWVNRSQSLKRGTDFVKFNRWAKNSIRGAQLTNLGANTYQTGESGLQAYRSWRENCNGQIPWGALIQTGLSGLGVHGAHSSLRRSFQQGSIVANKIGTSKQLINSFSEFNEKYHQNFKQYPNNAIIGWEWYQESATSNKTSIIGRLSDIKEAAPDKTFHRLNIRQKKGWKLEVNDAWLQGVIDAGRPVKLVSPIKKTTLKKPPNKKHKNPRSTVYRRELHQLKNAGYTIRNGWAIPSGTTIP